MNLRGIANRATSAINPNVDGVFKVNVGYVTKPGGIRENAYTELPVTVQLQELSSTDLRQVDAVNIQGILRTAYLNGRFDGVNRPNQKGGDFLLVNGETWLVTKVVEMWPDWIKVIVTQQVQK